jgi:hypothetical protein
MKLKTVLLAAGVWCAVLAFVSFGSLGVYQLSRWFVCGCALYGALKIQSDFRWLLVAVAVLFNPILPIRFSREVWQWLDGLAAAAFLIAAARISKGARR